MDPVRRLVRHLGGSFASYHFGEGQHGTEHSIADKFCMFGSHDLIAIIAMPDKVAAQAFRIAVASQDGVADVRLTALMPFENAVTSSVAASVAASRTVDYSGPGGSVHR